MMLFIILLISQKLNSSQIYSTKEIAGYMDKNLKDNNLNYYYMVIDTENLLNDINFKMLSKYIENLNKKYDLSILVILTNKIQDNKNSSFLDELYNQVSFPQKLKKRKVLIIIITADDDNLQIIANEKFKPIFSEKVINNLISKVKPLFKQNEWFSNIFELLKNVDILHQQYNFNIKIEDL